MANKPMLFRKRKPSEDILGWLHSELDEAYLDEVGVAEFKQKETFSPSTIGYGHGKCPRYWNLAFTGAVFEPKVSARGMAIMMNGIKVHERLQDLMIKRGILSETELEIRLEDPPVKGFLDGLIRFPAGEDIPVLEIKSANMNSFEARRSSNKPSDYHLIQLLIYLKAIGARRGVFLYECKDTQEPLFILVEMTEEYELLIEEVFDWLRRVRKVWDDGKKIQRPTKRKDAVICKQCPLYDTCWSTDSTEDMPYISPMEVKKA